MSLKSVLLCLLLSLGNTECIVFETKASRHTYTLLTKDFGTASTENTFTSFSFRVKVCDDVYVGLLTMNDNNFQQTDMTYVLFDKNSSQIVISNQTSPIYYRRVYHCEVTEGFQMKWNATGISLFTFNTTGFEKFGDWYISYTPTLLNVKYIGILAHDDALWKIPQEDIKLILDTADTTESASTTTDRVQTTTDRVLTTTNSAQTTTDRVLTTTDGVQTTTGRVLTTTNSAQTTTDRVLTATDRVQTTTDRVLTTTDSAQTTSIESITNASTANTNTSTVIQTCRCLCFNFTPPYLSTCTSFDIKCLVKELKVKLKVNKSALSSTIRKKISVEDDRPSAQALGVIGVLIIVISISLIVVPDVAQLVKYLYQGKDSPVTNFTKKPQVHRRTSCKRAN